MSRSATSSKREEIHRDVQRGEEKEPCFDMNVVRGIPCDRILQDYFQIGSGISQQFSRRLFYLFMYSFIYFVVKEGFHEIYRCVTS